MLFGAPKKYLYYCLSLCMYSVACQLFDKTCYIVIPDGGEGRTREFVVWGGGFWGRETGRISSTWDRQDPTS